PAVIAPRFALIAAKLATEILPAVTAPAAILVARTAFAAMALAVTEFAASLSAVIAPSTINSPPFFKRQDGEPTYKRPPVERVEFAHCRVARVAPVGAVTVPVNVSFVFDTALVVVLNRL